MCCRLRLRARLNGARSRRQRAEAKILIAEVQGDRVRLQLADHRQNVPDADIAAAMAEVDALAAGRRE